MASADPNLTGSPDPANPLASCNSLSLNTHAENPDPVGLDFLCGNESRIDAAEVIDFLSDTLDLPQSQQVEAAIANDPQLRNEIVNLKSTWEYLSLLPEPKLEQKPELQAGEILKQEFRRQSRIRFLQTLLITSFSIISVVGGWWIGTRGGRSYDAGLEKFARQWPLYQMVVRLDDAEQLGRLVTDDRSAIFAWFCPVDFSDLGHQMAQYSSQPLQPLDLKMIRRDYDHYLALPPDRQNSIEKMIDQVNRMTDDERKIGLMRLYGYIVWLDTLNDTEKATFSGLSQQVRWNRSVNNAQQHVRQAELAKKQLFSITELNSPEYVVDLATVTAAWLKMTPQERNSAERKFRNQTKDVAKRNDRVRQFMQMIDKSPPGTFPLLEMLKNAPPAKIAGKANPKKQLREQTRILYQESVKDAAVSPPAGPELSNFLKSLPPWLVELVEPLPPQEARRFLAILKNLIEKSAQSPS